MKTKILIGMLFALTSVTTTSAQQRWFETGTSSGAYRRVQWENVAIVIIYNPANNAFTTGAKIFTYADGKFADWGDVPKGSSSLTSLYNLVQSSKSRWVKMQPFQNGSYLKPNEAVGYADLKTMVGFTKVIPIEFGQEVFSISFDNFNGRGVVVDPAEKARIEKLIADSQNP